jgi:hypothetical protein
LIIEACIIGWVNIVDYDCSFFGLLIFLLWYWFLTFIFLAVGVKKKKKKNGEWGSMDSSANAVL